jgi:hypothetical protein
MQTMLYYGSMWLERRNAWKHMNKASYNWVSQIYVEQFTHDTEVNYY